MATHYDGGEQDANFLLADGSESRTYRVRRGDSPKAPLRIVLRREGMPVDLSEVHRTTLTVSDRESSRYSRDLRPDDELEQDGVVSRELTARDTNLETGTYRLEVEIRRRSGAEETYPNTMRLTLKVTE